MKAFTTILLLGASATSVSARPPHYPYPSSCYCPVNHALQQPVLASSADQLPAPDAGLVVKRIALGVGHQLYSCEKQTADQAPAPNGAKAVLYDANCATQNAYELGALHAASAGIVRAGLDERAIQNYLYRAGQKEARIVAQHYFLDATTPKFEFTDNSGDVFVGQAGAKLAVTTQPPAVPWLKLVKKTGMENESVGVRNIYRLETANGVAPKTCGRWAGSKQLIQVPYAAEYWFYD